MIWNYMYDDFIVTYLLYIPVLGTKKELKFAEKTIPTIINLLVMK